MEDDEPVDIGSTSAALTATDPVSAAVATTCTTSSVKGLSTQLVEEIQCLRPGAMKKIDGLAGLKLGASVFPYLQTPAADALIAAQKARNVTMEVNSGLRTLPQQFLLYRWYQTGRCGISLAASPGKSNHESAIAVDIQDNAAWRTALQGKGFRWLGANDPVHYDFTGKGAVDLKGLSVEAFQRLWNRNHPEDKIEEDGSYGTATEQRLAKAPAGGFPIGAKCDEGATPKPAPMSPTETNAIPDAEEPPADQAAGESDSEADTKSSRLRTSDTSAAGCSAAPGTSTSALAPLGILVGLAAIRRASKRRAARA